MSKLWLCSMCPPKLSAQWYMRKVWAREQPVPAPQHEVDIGGIDHLSTIAFRKEWKTTASRVNALFLRLGRATVSHADWV